MTTERTFTAIDPLALVLSSAVYIRLTLPDPAPDDVKARARELVQRLNPAERRQAVENLRNLEVFTRAIEAELNRNVEAERPQVHARA